MTEADQRVSQDRLGGSQFVPDRTTQHPVLHFYNLRIKKPKIKRKKNFLNVHSSAHNSAHQAAVRARCNNP